MVFPPHESLFLALVVFSLGVVSPSELHAETLPDRRPALVGSGTGSLVNLVDAEVLFRNGQRDAWVMFDCAVAGDGIVFGSDFFTASPNSDLLKNEIRRRLRQTRFIPAIYNHKRTSAWFSGTVVFVVANGRPHLRLYANQDLDVIKRGADFVAPQLIFVPNHYLSNLPNYPSAAKKDEAGGVVKLRHSVDANGKTTDVQVISERAYPKFGGRPDSGYQFGEYLTKVVPLLDFLPGYLNGRPTATSYTLTWVFGETIGR
jgi:Gram-negative bacterial TonB protein C-terminal